MDETELKALEDEERALLRQKIEELNGQPIEDLPVAWLRTVLASDLLFESQILRWGRHD